MARTEMDAAKTRASQLRADIESLDAASPGDGMSVQTQKRGAGIRPSDWLFLAGHHPVKTHCIHTRKLQQEWDSN